MQKYQSDFDKDNEVLILKMNLHQKKIIGRQIHEFIGQKSTYGT